jgi:hypothetical protein
MVSPVGLAVMGAGPVMLNLIHDVDLPRHPAKPDGWTPIEAVGGAAASGALEAC